MVKVIYVALKSMTCKILFRYTQYSWSRVKLLLGILGAWWHGASLFHIYDGHY